MFKAELIDALRIVERGDIAPQEMRGAWAGEIGQTQFMPSSYIKFAVDFDGNGRRDLLRSAPDVLASTANFLAGHGWQGGKDWEPGSANFAVIKEWNKSEVYAKTIGSFREPARARALMCDWPRADRGNRPLKTTSAPRACLAEMRRADAHLAVSIASCASDFLLRRDLAFAVGHGFDHGFGLGEISPLQPPPLQRWRDIAKQWQPLRLLRVTCSHVTFHSVSAVPASLPESAKRMYSRSRKLRMNSARFECDARATQRLTRNDRVCTFVRIVS